MSYYTPANLPSPMRDSAQVREQAEEYKQAYLQSDKRAREVTQKNGCHASELLRLSYFDPVRMFPVDPMHTILTGLIQNEASFHFNLPDVSGLTDQGMKIFQERAKHLEVPHNVGRLPVDISSSLTVWSSSSTVVALCHYQCLNLPYSLCPNDVSQLEELLCQHHDTYKEMYGSSA